MNAHPTAKPPKYLVCVDERSESHVALRLAAAKAGARGGAISLLHVMPPADFQTLTAVADRMRAEQREAAENLMQRLAAEIYALSGFMPGIILREGQIGEEIVTATTEDADATMLVLGVAEDNAKRGKLAAWLAGQLGSRVFIPLLMVPGNLTEQQVEALI